MLTNETRDQCSEYNKVYVYLEYSNKKSGRKSYRLIITKHSWVTMIKKQDIACIIKTYPLNGISLDHLRRGCKNMRKTSCLNRF